MQAKRELRVSKNVGLRDSGTGTRVAFGKAVVFNELSHDLGYFRERFAPGAFDECLARSEDILALVHHDVTRVLGRTRAKTLRMAVDSESLSVECDLPNTSYAADLVECLRANAIGGMSFAFVAVDEDWSKEDKIPIRTVKKADLFEVSWVTDPAYPQTTAGVRSLTEVFEANQLRLTEPVKTAPKRSIWKWKAILAGRSVK
jgi:HK97 family phage prohead protease